MKELEVSNNRAGSSAQLFTKLYTSLCYANHLSCDIAKDHRFPSFILYYSPTSIIAPISSSVCTELFSPCLFSYLLFEEQVALGRGSELA